MGLRDVTGVFSRFFVVGFFLPSFFVVLTLGALFAKVDQEKPILIIGGGALLMGLVLVGLRDPVWKAFERIPPNGPFGRATRRYHDHVRETWWELEVHRAWPFIQPFFTDHERELNVDARSDIHFFLNCSLGAVAIAVGLCVDAKLSPVNDAWLQSLALALVALLAAALAYLGAARAVRPWGKFKEAAVVLHRFELYERVGLPRPEDEEQERAVIERLNAKLYDPDDEHGWAAHLGGVAPGSAR